MRLTKWIAPAVAGAALIGVAAPRAFAQNFDDPKEFAAAQELLKMTPEGPAGKPWEQHLGGHEVDTTKYKKPGPYRICFSNASVDNPWRVVGWLDMQRQHEHEAAGESPGEVRALPRVDIKRAGKFPQRPGRLLRLGKPAILQGDREKEDEKSADRARDQEHGDHVAGEQLDQECAAHRRDRQTDPQDTRDQAALNGRDLVWQHRHHGGEQRVEEQLGETPSGEDDRDAGRQGDNEDAEGAAYQAADHPWPPHAQPRRGAVAHPAEERITEHRQQCAGPGDKRQAARCPFDPHQRVDLQCQGDQQGRDEQQAGAHVRQRVQRDKTPAHPVCRGWPGLQHSLSCGSVLQSAPRSTGPGHSPANRPTRDDMMIRKAMVIPLGHRNRTVLAVQPAYE